MGYRLQDGGQIDVASVCDSFICPVAYHNLEKDKEQKVRKRDPIYNR